MLTSSPVYGRMDPRGRTKGTRLELMSDIVKGALKFLRGFGFELGKELSSTAIEILRASQHLL